MDSLYGFLPFLRSGIASKIAQEDDTTKVGHLQRTSIDASVTLDLPSTTPITKSVQLLGPGDVINVAQEAYIRTEPAENNFEFDANLLPFIEFFEEDFLWRYTAANPGASSPERLRPWLALIVLKDAEFDITPQDTNALPASFTLKSGVLMSDVMHPSSQHWAFGHVQINDPKGDITAINTATDNYNDLISRIPTEPDIAFSRLLSSRKLQAGTSYTAFLIPAFELGRLAGLGADENLLATVGT
jgi:hypothetical protein